MELSWTCLRPAGLYEVYIGLLSGHPADTYPPGGVLEIPREQRRLAAVVN